METVNLKKDDRIERRSLGETFYGCAGCQSMNCNTASSECILKKREKETRLERVGNKIRAEIRR